MHYLEKELKELSIKELDILTFMQDALFDGMWYWDVTKPDNEWMDDRFWKTFGYDPSEMPASPSSWQGIVHPDDLKVAYVMIEKLIIDPTFKYDQILRYIHKKGHTVWIRCRGKAVRDAEGRALRILGLHQEITDYKKNESQIQEQIGRYNEVIARTGMSTWRYFLNENIIEHSSNFYEYLGYGKDIPDAMSLQDCMNVLHENDRDAAHTNFKELLSKRVNFIEFEARFRRLDGSYQWRICKASVTKSNREGHPEEIGGYTENIHSRKLVELEVLQYKEFLEQINKAARIGTWIVIYEPEFKMIWDPMIYDIHEAPFDLELELQAGINFYKEGDSRERISYLFNRASQEGIPFDDEFELVTYLGNPRHIRSIGIPVFENGKCTRVHGVFQDITERKETLNKVAYERERFYQTFRFAPIGLAVVDLDGRFMDVNPSFERILGYKKEELIQSKFDCISHPDDLESDWEQVKRLIRGDANEFATEKRYIRKDGEIVWVQLHVSAVRNKDNEVLQFISQIKDITDQKQKETEIKKLMTLNSEQKNRLLNFTHIVSHNLRSHSSNITMILDILKKEYKNIEDNEYFKMLYTSSQGLEETLHHLNDVLHIDRTIRDQMKSLSLFEYISKVIESLNAQISKRKAKIIFSDIEKIKVLRVNGVSAYLESILYNIMSNSIKHTPIDRDPVIEIHAHLSSPYVELQISDQGKGIDLANFGDRLFKMYSPIGRNEGKGLGLFITKNQVEAMGGTIEVKSKLNKGTTVKIRLIEDGSNFSKNLAK